MEEHAVECSERKESKLKITPDIYLRLMKLYGYIKNMRFNEMHSRFEILDEKTGEWRNWTHGDEDSMFWIFYKDHGVFHRYYLQETMNLLRESKKVNPLTDLLDSLQWDGKERILDFLIKTMGCADTPYNREASRLIFAQGVARAYEPGCKCDNMIVFVGNQGGGKSTLVQWLNMDPAFYGEVKTIMGKEGIEAIDGVWIGEVDELMAMTRVKEVEAVKAFITARYDNIRRPYEKYKSVLPRRCILIGTTNNRQFLNDKTGNRRFFPVVCARTGEELFEHEAEIKEEIRQCWAEAVHKYKAGLLPAYPDPKLKAEIMEQQESAMEDDWRVGMIRDYLDRKVPGEKVCVIELWFKALKMDDNQRPTRKDSIEIGQIIASVPGWVRDKKVSRCAYGVQMHHTKMATIVDTPEECPW